MALDSGQPKTRMEQKIEDTLLEARVKQTLEQDTKKLNRFAAMDGDTAETFQVKIDEYHKQQKAAEDKSAMDNFRRMVQTQLPQRLGAKIAPGSIAEATRDRLKRRTQDLYEPISKERNKELLEMLDSGMKRMDSQLDDRSTNQVFAEYIEKYKVFMADLAQRSAARSQHARTAEEIDRLLGAALSKFF